MLNYSFSILDKKLKKINLPLKQFDQVVKIVDRLFKIKENLVFDLSFVDSKQIKKINSQYRKVNRPTDVISFAFRDSKQSIKSPLLGEIFICYDVANKQAKENGWDIKHELCLLFIHGILHLFQYDHMTKKEYDLMIRLQNNIIKKVKF